MGQRKATAAWFLMEAGGEVSPMYVLRLRNKTVMSPGNRNVAIPIESARVCSVCWTVHQAEECPECKARQWRNLLDLLEVLGIEPRSGVDIRLSASGVDTQAAAS
jgi:hypothetical protein